MINVTGLKKRFAAVEALRGVEFRAEPGKITGLIGPNGAGKTTTMRILAGLIEKDAGEATIGGFDVGTLAASQQLGVLSHQSGLYPRLSGFENIEYYGELRGLSKAAIAERIRQLTRMLDLAEFAGRRAAGYSEGQRRRIGIARALISAPPYLILDEPSNGLDVTSARSLRDAIATLRSEGRAIVLSSHLMVDLESLCDFIYIVASGRTVWSGSVDALRQASPEGSAEAGLLSILARTAT